MKSANLVCTQTLVADTDLSTSAKEGKRKSNVYNADMQYSL